MILMPPNTGMEPTRKATPHVFNSCRHINRPRATLATEIGF